MFVGEFWKSPVYSTKAFWCSIFGVQFGNSVEGAHVGALINKSTFECMGGGAAYWKEGAKSNHYGKCKFISQVVFNWVLNLLWSSFTALCDWLKDRRTAFSASKNTYICLEFWLVHWVICALSFAKEIVYRLPATQTPVLHGLQADWPKSLSCKVKAQKLNFLFLDKIPLEWEWLVMFAVFDPIATGLLVWDTLIS